MASFSDRLSELISRKGIMKKSLAEFLGVTYKTINNYENGVREPSIDQLTKLADFFGVSIDYLTGRSDDPTRQHGVNNPTPDADETGRKLSWHSKSRDFAIWLRKTREQLGLTVEEFAKQCGLRPGLIGELENGTAPCPREGVLGRLYDVVNSSMDTIFSMAGYHPSYDEIAARYYIKYDDIDATDLYPSNDQGVSHEEREFLEWVDENLESSFFYDFSKSPEESKREMMETLKFIWEREKKRQERDRPKE